MTFERKAAPPPLLTYKVWKVQLRKDCERKKLLDFDSLEEHTLKLLWKNGFAPTVQAIVENIDL